MMRIIKCEICGKKIKITHAQNRTKYCTKCAIKRRTELQKKVARKHYLLDKEKYLERTKTWRNNNPDKVKSARDKWILNNKDYIYEQLKKYRKNNKDKVNSIANIYYKKNSIVILEKERIKANNLDTVYIKKYLRKTMKGTNPPNELIEFTKEHIRLKRLIKEMSNKPS